MRLRDKPAGYDAGAHVALCAANFLWATWNIASKAMVSSGLNPVVFAAYREMGCAAVLAGAVVVPAILPWLPARQFYVKGIMTGLLSGILAILIFADAISSPEALTLLLLSLAVSSYAAMNFTGATPFTSPSGVEKEMRQGIPIQVIAVLISIVAWVSAPFLA